MQQDNEDTHFSAVLGDMPAQVNLEHKSGVQFKIYQVPPEAERDFSKQSYVFYFLIYNNYFDNIQITVHNKLLYSQCVCVWLVFTNYTSLVHLH